MNSYGGVEVRQWKFGDDNFAMNLQGRPRSRTYTLQLWLIRKCNTPPPIADFRLSPININPARSELGRSNVSQLGRDLDIPVLEVSDFAGIISSNPITRESKIWAIVDYIYWVIFYLPEFWSRK